MAVQCSCTKLLGCCVVLWRCITENECLKAICQLANNKSPGPDGFSVEFYKCFWDDLKHPFMECLKYSINKDQLCKSQYEGVITLLPKPGKDLFLACNYRPITLLNCDYKIISKVINNRLCPLLPSLVSQDQSGFKVAILETIYV